MGRKYEKNTVVCVNLLLINPTEMFIKSSLSIYSLVSIRNYLINSYSFKSGDFSKCYGAGLM